MTSIPVAICRIYGNNFKRHDLENKRFKDFFWIFYCISEMYMKFGAFSKRVEHSSLIISEIIDAERRG